MEPQLYVNEEINLQPSEKLANREQAKNFFVMSLLALLVGTIGGCGAWVFRLLIGLLHNIMFLGRFDLVYDANVHTPTNPWGIGVVFVPVIGAMAVAWLVRTFAPEAKGHGVPEVMDAIHYNGGVIRPIVALIKSLASAISIGTGGSVGREGPIVQIGAAFGSTLGQIVRLPARQKITLIAAGSGAGIAATFNAPLGGIVFAIELLLISVNVRNILPVALATVTGSYIGRLLLGTYPAFNFPPLQVPVFHLGAPLAMLLFVPFGILMGIVSMIFIRGIYLTEDLFDSLPGNYYIRHGLGMLMVGSMLFLMWRATGHYYIEGVGYATIMDIITGILNHPWLLVTLSVLKLIATCLTIGSGGSGGIFSPALFIGATLGASCALALNHLFPSLPVDVISFTLSGMAAMVAASTGAVITSAVMLNEMTGDSNVVLPLIMTSVIAYGVRKVLSPESIYTLKLVRRGHIVPEGLQAAFDDARVVRDVMETDFRVIESGTPITPFSGVTVLTEHNKVVGAVHPYGNILPEETQSLLKEERAFISVTPDMSFMEVLREMQLTGAGCALVFSSPGNTDIGALVGTMTFREISTYHAKIADLY